MKHMELESILMIVRLNAVYLRTGIYDVNDASSVCGRYKCLGTEALHVLDAKFMCNVLWTKHIFQIPKQAFTHLGFLKRSKRDQFI